MDAKQSRTANNLCTQFLSRRVQFCVFATLSNGRESNPNRQEPTNPIMCQLFHSRVFATRSDGCESSHNRQESRNPYFGATCKFTRFRYTLRRPRIQPESPRMQEPAFCDDFQIARFCCTRWLRIEPDLARTQEPIFCGDLSNCAGQSERGSQIIRQSW